MIFSKNVESISWRAFRWLIGFYLICLLTLGSFFRIFVHKKVQFDEVWVQTFIGQLDQTLVYAFWILLVVALLFTFLFIRIFFSPLDVLIGKAKSIKRGQYNLKNSDVIKESVGEWYMLDLTLNKISKDLKRQKAEVEKERGELEAVITAANDAILAVDRDMNIRYYNAPMALFFDQKEEGNWGRHLREVIRNQNIIEAFQKAMKEKKSQRVLATQELSGDSSIHYYEISISPFFDEKKQKPRGAVAIFHDITEHKKVEKVRMDFVANASHELKTPLTSIQGYLNFIEQNSKDKQDLSEAFSVVNSNVKRLNRLITDLLELSKIESAENLNQQEIVTEEITGNVLHELKSSINEKGHKISQVFDATLLSTNPDLLEHVLINLIENAIKYCPESSEIKIHWGKSGQNTFLSVKDNGPGIESYHQGRLFERFYRVRDEQTQNTRGTGLGLSIVRNSMQKLGGTVDVKSAPGLGSEFICYFPN